jgi:antitoxin ParD1/3/4
MTARQSITLTPPNDAWLSAQVESEEYGSKSDVINALIRKERARQERISEIRAKLIEAEQSGPAVEFDRNRLLTEFKAELGL